MSGRKGSSGHQNLIRMASRKLLNELVGDRFLSVTLIREQPLDVGSNVHIEGEGFGTHSIVDTKVRLYADVACAAVFDANAKWLRNEPILPNMLEIAGKHRAEGNMKEYYNCLRSAYGVMIFLIECEINPRSHLLTDGAKLTAYKLLKQKHNNLVLILAIFEGTKVENPEVFDLIWEFPRKTR